ncbi:mcfE [Acrasis kona]|uniref:McfE n=1 Tax=Acrasis kona TaxID=1008807 RepID=A0AAW2YKP7_9EUKA
MECFVSKRSYKTSMTKDESVFAHLAGGAVAGLISDGIVHPIDTIRARLQTQKTQQYSSATQAFRSIVKTEGPLTLYRGFGAVAMGTIPGHALYFAGYERSKDVLNSYFGVKNDDSTAVHLASGLFADALGALAWTPQDVVKQRLQVQKKLGGEIKYKNSIQAAATILKEDGIRGLYRGYWAGLAAYGPYVSFYFAGYEQLKILCQKKYGGKDLPLFVHLFNAALAGSVSAALTCPLDVVKTRIQVQDKSTISYQYKNGWDALNKIIRNEGVATLFHGIKPRCLWMAGGTAITMAAYEELKVLLKVFSK